MRLRKIFPLLLVFIPIATVGAQDTGEGGPDFGLGITIGAQSFPNPDYDGSNEETITYQSLGLTPDLAIGKFGLGLDLTLNYRFTGGDGSEFEVRNEDWVPDDETTFLELYLPKIRYARWALKGDPLYVLFGSVDNGVLGNGFIMGGYTNTQFLPAQRLFGLSLDVDGQLFNFPYMGIETFVGNLAAFDLIGTRLYVRPLVGTGMPVIRNLQIGGTFVADRQPFYFAEDNANAPISTFLPSGTTKDEADVVIWGSDFRLPILTNPAFSLAAFGDYVNQNQNSGGMLGAGGRLLGVLTYGAQLRFLGEDFIPVYFDNAYDIYRPLKYAVYAGTPGFTTEPYVGWFASAGFSLLQDRLVFTANVDGPFNAEADPGTFQKPHLLATFMLAEGLLGGFSLEASYDKKGIDEIADLIDPQNSVIGARVNYRIDKATISLVYDLQYQPFPEPGDNNWVVTSKIESAISLF
ncbi:MAG: hypothetical protein ACOC2Q_02050 [Spirochaetota bacterium]